MANSTPPITPVTRAHTTNSRGIEVISRAAAHSAVPAAKLGMLASRLAAVPERITLSAIASTRNPDATATFSCLK